MLKSWPLKRKLAKGESDRSAETFSSRQLADGGAAGFWLGQVRDNWLLCN